jgi:hypothetical protein
MLMTTFSDIEREAIALHALVETINSMVNHETLAFGDQLEGAIVQFRSMSHRTLFNVLLVDTLEPVDKKLLGVDGSLIDVLDEVLRNPQFGTGDGVEALRGAAGAWRGWLYEEVSVETWFPSIDVNVVMVLARHEFIRICGNTSKHNVTRLTRKAKSLAKLLHRVGVVVSDLDALTALDDFHERFHVDILAYHSTTIAELLNNLRWAIHEYLLPEFKRAYVPPPSQDDPFYSFQVPEVLTHKYARERYWDLMNGVRGEPWIPRFTGTPHLKGQY